MARRVAGSLKKVTVNGISFSAAADANISWTSTQYENSVIATSGDGMVKKMKRVPAVESLPLIVTGEQHLQLQALADSLDQVKFSVTFQSGDVIKAQGEIELESYENEEGRLNVQLQPTGAWTYIPAA